MFNPTFIANKFFHVVKVFLITSLLFVYACQNKDCEEIKILTFETKGELISYLGGSKLPMIDLFEEDFDNRFQYYFGNDDNLKYDVDQGYVDAFLVNTSFGEFGIYVPNIIRYYRDSFSHEFPDSLIYTKPYNVSDYHEIKERWVNSDLYAIKLFNKIYLIDSMECLNCTEFPSYVPWGMGGHWQFSAYYLSYANKNFVMVYFDQQRWIPWLWVFDITDTANIKIFGFEDSYGPPNVGDFNNDGKLDIAVLQPETSCNSCDSLMMKNDPVYGEGKTVGYQCQKLLFYTYYDDKFDLLIDSQGMPYYINVAFNSFYFGPLITLSNHLWKK